MTLHSRAVVCALSSMLTLMASKTARAQGVGGFPITTMPSPAAPSLTPAPEMPASNLLPQAAAPAPQPTSAPASQPSSAPTVESEPAPEPAPHFGQRGQVATSGQFSASLGFLTYDNSPASSTSASFEPVFQYFFADGLFVGGSLLMRYESGTSAFGTTSSASTFGASARFGVNLPISKVLSFQPAAGLGFWQKQISLEGSSSGTTADISGAAIAVGTEVNETAAFISLYAPLLVHPAPHFFCGLGPEVFRDLTHSVDDGSSSSVNVRRTFLGLSSVVGGWF